MQRSTTIIAAAGAAGLAAAIGLGGVAMAASGPSGPVARTLAQADPGIAGPAQGGPGMGHRGMGGQGMGFPIHSEAVVKKDGKYVTVQHQRGEVTALSDGSITVKSEDGFESTYVINDSTKAHKSGNDAKTSEIKVGDTVMVAGTKEGDTLTAVMIGTGEPPRSGSRGPRGMWGQGGPSAEPSPSASSNA